MELLLINHPLDCPMCDKGGECPLQNQAMTNGQGETRFDGAKRTFPKPIALSAQVLLDRERCVSCARCTRFSEQIAGDPFIELLERGAAAAGRHRRGRAVRLLLLRQHRADLPGRRADRRVLPVPGPAVRPGVHAERLRALRVRLRAAHRPPPRRGHPAAGRRRPARSTRSGTATRAAGRSPTPPQPDRLITPLVRDDGRRAGRRPPGRRRSAVAARGLAAAAAAGRRRAARRPADRRGRLRLRQVRPGRARHQRHRLPGPPALGRGGAVPRRARGRPRRRRSRYADLEQAPGGAAGRVRARGGVADRLPAAAQGGPRAGTAGLSRRAVRQPRAWTKLSGVLLPTVPGAEAAVAGRAGRRRRRRLDEAGRAPARALRQPGAVILVGERLAEVPGALSAAVALAARDRRPAGLGAAPGRRARRGRGRRAAHPAARRPPGRRRRPRGPRWPGPGASASLPADAGPRHRRRSSPPPRPGELAALRRRRRRPGRPARPGRRAGGAGRRPASWSAWSCAPARSPSAPTSCCRSPRSPRRPARS